MEKKWLYREMRGYALGTFEASTFYLIFYSIFTIKDFAAVFSIIAFLVLIASIGLMIYAGSKLEE